MLMDLMGIVRTLVLCAAFLTFVVSYFKCQLGRKELGYELGWLMDLLDGSRWTH